MYEIPLCEISIKLFQSTLSCEDCKQSIFHCAGFSRPQIPLHPRHEAQCHHGPPSYGRRAFYPPQAPRNSESQTETMEDSTCMCFTKARLHQAFSPRVSFSTFVLSTKTNTKELEMHFTCPFTESTFARMYFLTAAIRVARFWPVDLIVAIWNFTISPCCKKSCLSARLVIPYVYVMGFSSEKDTISKLSNSYINERSYCKFMVQ